MSTLSMARRRPVMPAVLVTVLVGIVPLVSACADGENAPTKLEYSVADGVQAHAGNVVMRDLQLVADVGASGGGAKMLALQGLVANNTGSNDLLTGVTAATASASVPFTPGTAAPVVPGTSLILGTNGLGLQVSALPAAVLPGSLVSLTFSFKVSGSVTVDVPVYSSAAVAPTAGSPSPVVFPSQPINDDFNLPEYDNESAVPTS